MMASDIQNNEKYHSWLKTSLALKYLREGISDEINQKALDMHNKIKQVVKQKNPKAVLSLCNHCNSEFIKKVKQLTNAGTHLYINCKSNICNHWLDQLIQYHEHLPCPKVEWANCNPTLWPSTPWEVAKVFQPYGCATHKSAEDSDIAGLLTFMLDCKFFNGLLTNKQILKDIKAIRNRIMHSSALEVEEPDMITWLDKMTELLEDSKHFSGLPACKTAAFEIKQLKSRPMKLSFGEEDEKTGLNWLVASLTGAVQSLKDKVASLIPDIDLDERNRDFSTTSTDICQIKEEMKTLQTSLNGLCALQLQKKLPLPRDQFDNLSKQLGELSVLEDRISVLESEMSAMKSGLCEVQRQLSHLPVDNRNDMTK